jgi:CheY-like chemotaxis protein
MPGMDGWAVLGALKGDPLLADIPVVMLTMVDDRNLGFTLGAAEFLPKPIERERLLRVLRKCHNGAPPGHALVVEDEPAAREHVRRHLAEAGWEVTLAGNGREGLERIAERRPDLILLDLMMPIMDGFTFLEELRHRANGVRIPVVVVTAKDLTAEDRGRLTGRVFQVLHKGTLTRDGLLHEVQRMVAERVREECTA